MSRTKDFKALERRWYQILAESGFEDIEDTRTPERFLKKWTLKFGTLNPDLIAETRLYYEEANYLLHRHVFESKTEKLIWKLHCEGLTIEEISFRIRKYKRSMIHNIISKLASRIKR